MRSLAPLAMFDLDMFDNTTTTSNNNNLSNNLSSNLNNNNNYGNINNCSNGNNGMIDITMPQINMATSGYANMNAHCNHSMNTANSNCQFGPSATTTTITTNTNQQHQMEITHAGQDASTLNNNSSHSKNSNASSSAVVQLNNTGDSDDNASAQDGLGPHDILCGRTSKSFNNIGNRRFRVTITSNVPAYIVAKTKADKTVIIHSVIRTIREQGGRFLKRDRSGEYVELDDTKIREKVGHALRDLSVMTTTKHQTKHTKKTKKQPHAMETMEERLKRLYSSSRSKSRSSAKGKSTPRSRSRSRSKNTTPTHSTSSSTTTTAPQQHNQQHHQQHQHNHTNQHRRQKHMAAEEIDPSVCKKQQDYFSWFMHHNTPLDTTPADSTQGHNGVGKFQDAVFTRYIDDLINLHGDVDINNADCHDPIPIKVAQFRSI